MWRKEPWLGLRPHTPQSAAEPLLCRHFRAQSSAPPQASGARTTLRSGRYGIPRSDRRRMPRFERAQTIFSSKVAIRGGVRGFMVFSSGILRIRTCRTARGFHSSPHHNIADPYNIPHDVKRIASAECWNNNKHKTKNCVNAEATPKNADGRPPRIDAALPKEVRFLVAEFGFK